MLTMCAFLLLAAFLVHLGQQCGLVYDELVVPINPHPPDGMTCRA